MILTLYEPFRHWSETGSVYILSNPHLGDSDCKLMDPGWIEPEEQVARINAVVGRSLPSIDNVDALSELFRVPIDKIICGNRGYQPEQRSIYYRLKTYMKYLQLYEEVTYEEVSLFSN